MSNRGREWDVWLRNNETGRENKLNIGASFDSRPVIAGSRVAYLRREGQTLSTYVLDLSPGRPPVPERLCDDCGLLGDLSADGSNALFHNTASAGGAIVSVATNSKRKTVLAMQPKRALSNPRFSLDSRWIAFHASVDDPASRQIFVAPVRSDNAPATAVEWIPITDGHGMDVTPSWSPDGNTLYWISERDGRRCIAYRRLDPETKKAQGELSYVQHFHGARRSMMHFEGAGFLRPSIARDNIVFSLAGRTGNIWMTELPK